jgi:hypothetical protein
LRELPEVDIWSYPKFGRMPTHGGDAKKFIIPKMVRRLLSENQNRRIPSTHSDSNILLFRDKRGALLT